MIRVLHVIDTLERGGAEQSLLSLTSRMDRTRFQPMVCQLYRGDALRPAFESANVRVESLGIQAKYGFVRAVRWLRALIERENVDVVHTSLFRAGQVGRLAAWRAKRPVVSTFSGVPYDASRVQNETTVQAWKLSMLRRMDATTARLVTRFHSVSNVVRDLNCQHLNLPLDRVTVIPRGRDVTDFAPPPADQITSLRQSAEFAGATAVVLNVGRLVPAKGQSVLIEAMRRVHEQEPGVRLLIAGEGPLRHDLEAQIAAYGLADSIRLLGSRGDVPGLLHAADGFAFSSLHEGLPGALIEAQLAKLPAVASDIPMHRELIQNQQTGLLVPAGDPLPLAEAIISLCRNREEAQRLASAAYERAIHQFDIQDVVERFQQLFVDVVTPSHPPAASDIRRANMLDRMATDKGTK